MKTILAAILFVALVPHTDASERERVIQYHVDQAFMALEARHSTKTFLRLYQEAPEGSVEKRKYLAILQAQYDQACQQGYQKAMAVLHESNEQAKQTVRDMMAAEHLARQLVIQQRILNPR